MVPGPSSVDNDPGGAPSAPSAAVTGIARGARSPATRFERRRPGFTHAGTAPGRPARIPGHPVRGGRRGHTRPRWVPHQSKNQMMHLIKKMKNRNTPSIVK